MKQNVKVHDENSLVLLLLIPGLVFLVKYKRGNLSKVSDWVVYLGITN